MALFPLCPQLWARCLSGPELTKRLQQPMGSVKGLLSAMNEARLLYERRRLLKEKINAAALRAGHRIFCSRDNENQIRLLRLSKASARGRRLY